MKNNYFFYFLIVFFLFFNKVLLLADELEINSSKIKIEKKNKDNLS